MQVGEAAYQHLSRNVIPVTYRGVLDPSISSIPLGGLEAFSKPIGGAHQQSRLSSGEEFFPPLAGVTVSFNELHELIQYPRNELDPEDLLSIHRFCWLLSLVTQAPSIKNIQKAVRCIEDWVNRYPVRSAGIGWDAYSVSERIVNWTFFLFGLRAFPTLHGAMEQLVVPALFEHLVFLRQHLEFHGPRTNNHVINNARALYIGGRLVQDIYSAGLGQEILSSAIPEQFTKSGFLREGSSHYHLLLCRSYLEVSWFARWTNDVVFYEKIRASLNQMLKATEFFLAFRDFPLIGDVSPDFKPAYHFGLLGGARHILEGSGVLVDNAGVSSKGWELLFPSVSGCKEPRQMPLGSIPAIQSFSDAGYHRITFSDYSLLFYCSPLGYIPSWSHGHGDLGSFLLYWKDQLLFVDCGRLTYVDDSWGRYGRSVRSHNSFSIDGQEPCIVHGLNAYPELMHPHYLSSSPEVQIDELSPRKIVARVTNHSYERLFNVSEVVRLFICEPDQIIIEDHLQGESTHLVETFFHVHPNVKVQDYSESGVMLTLQNDNLSFSIRTGSSSRSVLLREQGPPDLAGWYFPSYGERVPTATLRVEQRAEFPLVNRYILESVR